MKIVLDASVAVAAARPNEPSHAPARLRIVRVLSGADEAVVPAIFAIEVGSALARAGEAPAAVRAYVDALVLIASGMATIGPRTAKRILDVAIASRLRSADAAYVWLAMKHSVPLCTLDQEVMTRGAPFCQVLPP
jgi:predicted nucleic acid-binding protein